MFLFLCMSRARKITHAKKMKIQQNRANKRAKSRAIGDRRSAYKSERANQTRGAVWLCAIGDRRSTTGSGRTARRQRSDALGSPTLVRRMEVVWGRAGGGGGWYGWRRDRRERSLANTIGRERWWRCWRCVEMCANLGGTDGKPENGRWSELGPATLRLADSTVNRFALNWGVASKL